MGTKALKAKDRITLIVAMKADGSNFLPITVIVTARNPKAFNLRCPVPYLAQRRHGMTVRLARSGSRGFSYLPLEIEHQR